MNRPESLRARLAPVGAMLGFLAMWGMLAAACWAAGGVQ